MRFIGLCLFAVSLSGCSTFSHAPVQRLNVSQEVLALHNQMRAAHQAPPLVWNNTLANYAAQYASQCRFKHSHGPYGENLATGYRNVHNAVVAWYNEKQHYHHDNPGFSLATGHYTQMVWRSTTEIGCAYVVCNGINGTPGKLLVCEYNPPGNVIGARHFEENVLS